MENCLFRKRLSSSNKNKMIIVNSSQIIILGKQGFLDLFEKCFKKIIIPRAGYNEVMCKEESPEAISLKKAIHDKWCKVKETEIISALQS